MDFLDRIELFIRCSLLGVTMMFLDLEGAYLHKQIKRITSIVYNNGNESIQSDESESRAMAEGTFRDIGFYETEGSTGTGEGDEEIESGEYSGEESDESENQSVGISDDSFRSSNVVYERRS